MLTFVKISIRIGYIFLNAAEDAALEVIGVLD